MGCTLSQHFLYGSGPVNPIVLVKLSVYRTYPAQMRDYQESYLDFLSCQQEGPKRLML